MTTANKKTLKQVAIALICFAAYAIMVHVVPDGSLFKEIFSYFMLAAIVFGSLYYTGVLGYIRYKFSKKNKKE